MTAWTAAAVGAQEQFLARLAASGARIAPEYRYVRVLNGFSARLDPTSLALLDRDREVAGVYPVRIAYPAQSSQRRQECCPPRRRASRSPGSTAVASPSRFSTPASIPRIRTSARRVLSGLDVIDPGSGGIAQPHPTIPGRPERHGTELAGIIAGIGRAGRAARGRARRVDPPRPRRRLAAGLRGRVQRLLADRPDPRGTRGSRRSERRRRRARRGTHRAHRDGGAVRVVRRRARSRADRGRGRSRHARHRPGRERRKRRAGLRKHRGAWRRGRVGDHGRGRGRTACGTDGSRARPRRAPRRSTRTACLSAARPSGTVTADVVLVDRRAAVPGGSAPSSPTTA